MDEIINRILGRARPRGPEVNDQDVTRPSMRPRTPGSGDEPSIPGPSRVRSLSPDPDEEPRPKKPCVDNLPYRKRFGGL